MTKHKYNVTVFDCITYSIEAESPDEARNLAWDMWSERRPSFRIRFAEIGDNKADAAIASGVKTILNEMDNIW